MPCPQCTLTAYVYGQSHIHLIDFSTLDHEGSRFKDLTRLEAEIKFKLTDIDQLSSDILPLLTAENILSTAGDDGSLAHLQKLPLPDAVAKMVGSIVELRQMARSLCSDNPCDNDWEIEYKIGLLAQTTCICLYGDYLEQHQKEFAVISAAMLVDRLLAIINQPKP